MSGYWVQKKQAKVKTSAKLQQYKESNYMDPAQGLCLGALFDIAATNVNLHILHFNFLNFVY